MEVKNEIMYHFHKKGIYDELWSVGKEITVDQNFRSFYSKISDGFTTGVHYQDNKFYTLDRIIDICLKNDIFTLSMDNDLLKQILVASKQVIMQTNICRREFALEQIRKEFYPSLPSRFNSIWLTDENNLNFWKNNLVENKSDYSFLELYQVDITGDLFKSSDYFIPKDKLTMLEMFEQAKKYWNPEFINDKTLIGTEYLFQGKLKIIRKTF